MQEEIIQGLRRLARSENEENKLFYATVKKLNTDNTCTLDIEDSGFQVLANLRAATWGDSKTIHTPKIDSKVVCGIVNGAYVVLLVSSVKEIKIEFEATQTVVLVKEGKIEISNGGEDLKTILIDLNTELITSFTAISAVVPIANLPNYAAILGRLNLLFG